mgnify:CR=1 FL=1
MAETTIITIQITTDRSGTGTLAKETIKKRNELINRLLSGEIMDISYEEQTNTAYIAVKETQIENLSIGQEVSVTVDAISDKEFKGKVTSISGATGSKYSLVPTDNSAGNFVKIQQRIPVRIDFTDLSKEDNERLAAGMMVVVKAKL